MMNTFGTATWFGYAAPFEERLKAIKAAGFTAISTFWDKIMEEYDCPLLAQPETADRFGLTLEHAHIPYNDSIRLWQDDLDGEAYTELCIDAVKTAGQCGMKTLVIHPVDKIVPPLSEYPIMFNHMRRIADVSEQVGVRLAIENLNDKVVIEKIITDLWDNPYVGLCFDSGHNHICNGDDFRLLELFKDRLFALHIHDNNGIKDQHLLPFSDGCTVNWQKCVQMIDQTTFDGSLMLEACYPIDYDAMEETEDEAYENPAMPMTEWLETAATSCEKVLKL